MVNQKERKVLNKVMTTLHTHIHTYMHAYTHTYMSFCVGKSISCSIFSFTMDQCLIYFKKKTELKDIRYLLEAANVTKRRWNSMYKEICL